MPPPCYILCGGQSRRFGSDKARVAIAGQPQLLALTAALQAAGHEVRYVADRPDRYADLGITCLVDAQPGSGPMAGLASGLRDLAGRINKGAGEGWLLLLSCDQARWDEAWFRQLNSIRRTSSDAQAVAFYDTAWQPLPALYRIDLLGEVQQRLQARRLSLQTLLSDLDSSGRCAQVVTKQSPSTWSFNTPDELAGIPKR